MHEMALAESMLEIVESTARRNAARRVTAVRLTVGELARVETEALRFCFDVVARGTLAEAARLEIEALPGRAWCIACSASVPLGQRGDPCPACGSFQLAIDQGEELRVADIEVV